MSARADAARPMPGPAVLLLAGAGLHLVIIVATRTVTNGYLELAAGALMSYALSAMPMILAAALVTGRDRWPDGGRWLVAAAVVFGMIAILDAAGWIWLSLAWPPDSPDTNEGLVLARSTLLLAGAIVAPLLVATGLSTGRASASVAGNWPAIRRLGIGVAVVAVILSILPMLAYYDDVLPFFDGENERPLSAALSALSHLAPAAIAILGVAAARAIPRRYLLPEALIAVGALAAALGSAADASAYLVLGQAEWQGLVGPIVMASTGLALLGFATVALGFFTARISAPGEP